MPESAPDTATRSLHSLYPPVEPAPLLMHKATWISWRAISQDRPARRFLGPASVVSPLGASRHQWSERSVAKRFSGGADAGRAL